MTEQNNKELKQWWEILELAKADWFPLNSRHAIINAIEGGKLKAVQLGNKKYRYFKVSKEEALKFIVNNTN